MSFATPVVDPQRNERRWFDAALKAPGIADDSGHCNRHTFTSRLVMAGVDIRAAAEFMGHNGIQVTMMCFHSASQLHGSS